MNDDANRTDIVKLGIEARRQLAGFTLPPTEQEQQFSIAFLRAIASAAGYGVEETSIDFDSVDLTIVQYGLADSYPQIEALRIQVKSTYVHSPKDDGIHFPLKKRNYDHLRRECQNPRILVVVHLPRDVDDWLVHCQDWLALHYDAYWVSLHGFPPRENASTVTVTLPDTQRFTIQELRRIMDLLAQGKRP